MNHTINMRSPEYSTKKGRRLLLTGLLSVPLWLSMAQAQGPLPAVEVWKSPTCGCCKDWIKHMEQAGFEVTHHDVGNAQARTQLNMPQHFGSCHTAKIGHYVIEGHVPANDIKRLLAEQPDALGLAVPGMPIGSPGMDGPAYKGHVDPHQVLLIHQDGSTRTYATYGKK